MSEAFKEKRRAIVGFDVNGVLSRTVFGGAIRLLEELPGLAVRQRVRTAGEQQQKPEQSRHNYDNRALRRWAIYGPQERILGGVKMSLWPQAPIGPTAEKSEPFIGPQLVLVIRRSLPK
jgi:hypothetical protein